MSEYIEREVAVAIASYAADEHPYKEAGKPETYSQYEEGWSDACDYIRGKLEDTPTVDAVAVVRCKDCKHRVWFAPHYGWGNFESPFYAAVDGDVAILTKPDDFCSYGERKSEDEH